MRYEKSKGWDGPLLVNDDFLESLSRWLEKIRPILIRSLSDSSGLPVESVEAAIQDSSFVLDDDPQTSAFKHRELSRHFNAEVCPDIVIRYPNDEKFKVGNLNDLRLVLKDEMNSPESIRLSVGGFSKFSADIELRSTRFHSPISISSKGTRDDVEFAVNQLQKAIEKHETSNAFLYNKNTARLLHLVVFLVSVALLLIAISSMEISQKNVTLVANIGIPTIAFCSFLISSFIANTYRELFDPLSFAYGLQARRAKEKIKMAWSLFSVIGFPLTLLLVDRAFL